MGTIMHNQPPRSDVLAHVGTNLRTLRKEAGLSQEALAAASGISRRMIVNLESGNANISLGSLDRLAEALNTTFLKLVSNPAQESRKLQEVMWRGKNDVSQATLLGATPARQDTQLWLWSLAAGERYVADPDPEGWHEMVFVLEGTLQIDFDTESQTVTANDFTIYSSAQNYAYQNTGTGVLRFLRTVSS
ncbi:Cro/Cl family transcriptional regulator [Acetobacter indonesiensis]|uniref:Transcriptional regulator n=2 Tax=Acetobacter indonesiensis TaxID=104101 RepID=A0A252AXV3_9PROT|nr:Cro/Cl family transcriptional regulator [Acetobacter indonesiensis]OUI96950.1 Cro/Cl family transcriptional regulator [Acetobacter indonesiensis]GAN63397.1 transcriptional regulator XRE [Acetobacter indonesiensis]GEN03515.1 transcriptional regulator [Acetobacter indonesiensis]